MKPALRGAIASVLVLAARPALALDAAQVFEKVAPSVWAVRGLDAQKKPIEFGSAVVIAPGKVVTACHVLARAKAVELRRENQVYEARLESPDVERDLCILSVPRLGAPPARLAAAPAKIGQHVYVVHYPQDLGVTLGEGLISGLGSEDPKLPPIQTTAVLPPGSAGGGLFDDQGALVGVTTLIPRPSPAAARLQFALPASWIAEAAPRAEAQLAKRAASPAGRTAAGLPAVGSSWKYSHRDRQYRGPARIFTVRVSGLNGGEVQEITSVDGGPSASSNINPMALRFIARHLAGENIALELAPYLTAEGLAKLAGDPQRPEGYPYEGPWQITEPAVESDDIVIAAGTFKTVRLQVSGKQVLITPGLTFGGTTTGLLIPTRFRYTAWYSPQMNRLVQTRHETWNRTGSQIGDEFVELVEYRKP